MIFCAYAGILDKSLYVCRTGKRTFAGMLKDGYNSGIRYFMNNFYDGFRQVRIAL